MPAIARIREGLEPTGPDFSGERLTACLNPRLREKRRRKRKVINRRVGRGANRRKVGKRFGTGVADDGISWRRREGRIATEVRPGAACVIRASLDSAALGSEAAVEDCKDLASVERAFLTMKASRPRIQPVHGGPEDHVRAHVFLRMLACHVERHMRRCRSPLLSGDDGRGGARA